MSVGMYKGVNYRKMRICDVCTYSTIKERWWFIFDKAHKAEGSHFKTLKELKLYIDKIRTAPEKESEVNDE